MRANSITLVVVLGCLLRSWPRFCWPCKTSKATSNITTTNPLIWEHLKEKTNEIQKTNV
jgi:hypothetical protein